MHTPTGPILATALAATFAVLASPALAAEKTIELPAFTAVDISSGIDAEITVGGTQSIVAESPDAGVLERMQIRVVGSELQAWFDWNILDLFTLGIDRAVTLKITVPELVQAEASAGADIVVTGMTGDALDLEASSGAGINATTIAGGAVSIETSSGASVDAAGTCTTGNFDVSSGADLDTTALLCADADVDVSSGANAEIYASASVVADASSGGDVTVHGSPAKTDGDSSSGGDVTIVP
jgi:hypothetical protein